jgi:hypothetical protein
MAAEARLAELVVLDFEFCCERTGETCRARDGNELFAAAPKGCAMRAKRVEGRCVGALCGDWKIAVGVATPLTREAWMGVRRQMMEAVGRSDMKGAEEDIFVVLVPREAEASVLEAWEKEVYDVEETMGEWREVRELLGLCAEEKREKQG